MKIANNQLYPTDVPDALIDRIFKSQSVELLDAAMGQMEKDKWYAIRWSDEDFVQIDSLRRTKRMQIEIEPIREKTLVHVSTEQIHLTPSAGKPFFEKLKNCINYLRDKSGGRLEEKEVIK